jgi:hypothetical protein
VTGLSFTNCSKTVSNGTQSFQSYLRIWAAVAHVAIWRKTDEIFSLVDPTATDICASLKDPRSIIGGGGCSGGSVRTWWRNFLGLAAQVWSSLTAAWGSHRNLEKAVVWHLHPFAVWRSTGPAEVCSFMQICMYLEVSRMHPGSLLQLPDILARCLAVKKIHRLIRWQ